jgi:hypothetical protein
LSLAALLSACGGSNEPGGESADDFASRINGSAPTAAGAQQTNAAPRPDLPQPAANGREGLAAGAAYVQASADGTVTHGLTIQPDGSFELIENGQKTNGTYEWLPDGRRLRLNGVETRPIVLVADGALYRLTNENVPLDDLTSDRMYTLNDAPPSAPVR